MRRCCLAIVLAALLGVATHAFAQDSPQRWFIVHLTLGAAWDKSKPPAQQPGFTEHSANLRALREAGRLAMGARYADKGLLVVRAVDADEARSLFAADPMVTGNLFALQVDELRVFYPGAVGEPAPRTLPRQMPPAQNETNPREANPRDPPAPTVPATR